MLPTQILPETKKGLEWAKRNVIAINKMAGSGTLHAKDKLCFDLYYGMQNETDFEYLTGKDEYRMPARIRFMPIAKPYFELLKSTNEGRKLNTTVHTIDQRSLQKKKEEMAKVIVDRLIARVTDSQQRLSILNEQLQERKQLLQQEGQQMDPATRQMEIQLGGIEQAIGRADEVLREELEDLEKTRKHKVSTSLEIQMGHALKAIVRKYGWKDLFDQCFEDLMIVDQEVIRIEDAYLGKDPQIRRVNPMMISYGADMNATWLDECPWIEERTMMSVAQILDEFGDELNDDDRATLHKRYDFAYGYSGQGAYSNYQDFNAIPYGSTDACANIYSGSAMYTTDMLEVRRVAWKSSRQLRIRDLDGQDEVTSLQTALIHDGEIPDKDTKMQFRYVSDWWEGTRIGQSIFVRCRKVPFQHRDIERVGRSYGPYIGWNYNGIDKRPYSRVFATKDISILYNLVYYQMELLIALSGIKGVIMDKSQIPNTMEMEEWMYHFKQGTAWIDSQRTNAQGRPSNFNQFGTYDLSFGTSIQQCQAILERLEYLAGRVIGIPPQRLGEINGDTQVGTQKTAIDQSNLTTAPLFYKHDRFKSRVLDRVINVATHTWKNGKRGQYILGSYGQQIFEIASGDLDGVKLEVYLEDSNQNAAIMDRVTSVMEQSTVSGNMMLSQLMEAYSIDNLKELQDSVRYHEGVARKMMQQGQQDEAAAEQERIKADGEIKVLLKKQLTDGEALNGRIAEAELKLEEMRIQAEMQAKGMDTQTKAQTTTYVADQNAQVDREYLGEERRKTNLETDLRRLELVMNANSQNNSISSTPSKNKPPAH